MQIFTFTWFIQNYSYLSSSCKQYLLSPNFFAEMLQGTSWSLHLYPTGTICPNYLSLLLRRSDDCEGPEKITFNCELSILDNKGEALKSTELKKDCKNKNDLVKFEAFYEQPGYNLVNRGFTLDILRIRCKMWIDDGDVIKEDICYAKTQIGQTTHSFINIVENFSTLEPDEKKEFGLKKSDSRCSLEFPGNLYIKSKTDSENKVIMEIPYNCVPDNLITCQIYMLKSTGEEVECGRIDPRYDKRSESALSVPLCFGSECLSNNKLTLRFECTLSTGIEYEAIEETLYDSHLTPLLRKKIHDKYFGPPALKPKSVPGDLRSLYEDNILYDIQIKTKNKTFEAHKSILAARSPVLRKELERNIKGEIKNSIEISDLDDTTMKTFLHFLYTDTLEDHQWENIKKLYNAAVKYKVQRLKDECISILSSLLHPKNMSELLIFAVEHQDSFLKSVVEKYMCRRHKQIFFNEVWEKFMDTNPQLAGKAMYFYLKNSKC